MILSKTKPKASNHLKQNKTNKHKKPPPLMSFVLYLRVTLNSPSSCLYFANCQDYGSVLLLLVHLELGMGPRASGMLGRHFVNSIPAPAQHVNLNGETSLPWTPRRQRVSYPGCLQTEFSVSASPSARIIGRRLPCFYLPYLEYRKQQLF